jgi:hypothetical protein
MLTDYRYQHAFNYSVFKEKFVYTDRGCAMLPDWTILLIVLRENKFSKCICFYYLLYGQINKKSSACVTFTCM